LDRQVEHDLVVVVGHGLSNGRDGEIHLLDRQGQPAVLRADDLLSNPRALAGASVLLLSCHTGRAGHLIHRPGGVAGACLMAGAREVVAPLHAVEFRAAINTAVPLIRAFVEGATLSKALSTLSHSDGQLAPLGPHLGPIEAPRKRSALDSFVCWVG